MQSPEIIKGNFIIKEYIKFMIFSQNFTKNLTDILALHSFIEKLDM